MEEKPKLKTDDIWDLMATRVFCGLPVSGPYVPAMYELRYRCSRCGYEWDDIHVGLKPIEETQDCRMGCTKGYYNPFSLVGLYKRIEGLITGKKPYGFGRLIEKKKIQ